MSRAPKTRAKTPRKAAVTDLPERVMREDAAVAFADPRTCFGPDGAPLPPSDLPADIARAVASVECKESTAKSGAVSRTWKYAFWSKEKALERLARHLGLANKDPEKGRRAVVNFVMDLGPRGPKGAPDNDDAKDQPETEDGR